MFNFSPENPRVRGEGCRHPPPPTHTHTHTHTPGRKAVCFDVVWPRGATVQESESGGCWFQFRLGQLRCLSGKSGLNFHRKKIRLSKIIPQPPTSYLSAQPKRECSCLRVHTGDTASVWTRQTVTTKSGVAAVRNFVNAPWSGSCRCRA